MNNKQAPYKLFIVELAGMMFTAGLTGCSAEIAGASGISTDNPVPVTITLSPEKAVAAGTKSATGPIAPEITPDDKINRLDIYIVNAEGTIEKHVTESDFTFSTDDARTEGTTSSPVELLPGTKTVYAFANCRGFSDLGLTNDWTAVPDVVSNNQSTFNVLPEITASNGFPMSAYTTWEITETSPKAETAYAVQLIRMAAQMRITVVDERENKTSQITSLSIKDFLPGTTQLFRTASGKDDLPGSTTTPTLSDWKWEQTTGDATPPSIPPFYLHETTGTFDVSMQIADEANLRTTAFTQAIPRNRIYPLTIYLTDYSLDIEGTYQLAAIGTAIVSKKIGNGYTIELPEGASNIKINIQLKENGTAKTSGVTWTCTSLPAHFSNSSGENTPLVLSSAAIPAITAEYPVTVTAVFTKGGSPQTRQFDLTIKANPLTDSDLTKATPGEPQTISIEL